MTFEQAIRSKYGKTLPTIASDGKLKAFRVNGVLSGFALRLQECGVFGDFDSGAIYEWTSAGIVEHKPEAYRTDRLNPQELAFERIIINCGMGLIERGEELSDADLRRLGKAMDNVRRADVG